MLQFPRRYRAFRRYFFLLASVAFLFSLTTLVVPFWAASGPAAQDTSETPPPPTTERIFIASTHWNNEEILRSHWNLMVVKLAEELGPGQVYVSVYESGSWDDSKGALKELKDALEQKSIGNTMVLDKTTHLDEMNKVPAPEGWIDTPKGKKELRRIPYLAKLRNLSLKPLKELAAKDIKFDKILFLNDVVFAPQDVLRLLATRDGSYAAACALDFENPPAYYDTFALRDDHGSKAVSQVFPYFSSSTSRQAAIADQPIPVQSCWNGMAIFDASPFYATEKPLQFRGVSDSLARHHLEGSECCLVHFDNPLSREKGVWLNPNVRVAYSSEAYDEVHSGKMWPSMRLRWGGIWRNRLTRWLRFTKATLERWVVAWRVRAWRREAKGNVEPGVACLINEMQVLVENGWAHV
ncbi:MAG: hypothetical protein M1824_004661 [Vezdaea acicularis]|nr:MAG: hypothetical protein M1824_004661 [Vezdaea acicularis]